MVTKLIEGDDFNISMLKSVNDPKKRIKVIKMIEKAVRGSEEYRRLIRYLKQEMDLTKSTFFNNIDTSIKKYKKISLEFHHHPFGLWDIVDIVLEKHIQTSGCSFVNTFTVADEVMVEHYNMNIGLVPLTTTNHGLVHDGKLHLQKCDVTGNVEKFGELYLEYMNPEQKVILFEYLKDDKLVDDHNDEVLRVEPQKILIETRDEFKMLNVKSEGEIVEETVTTVDMEE